MLRNLTEESRQLYNAQNILIGYAARRASQNVSALDQKHVCRYCGALGCGEMPRVTIASSLLFTGPYFTSFTFILLSAALPPLAAWAARR